MAQVVKCLLVQSPEFKLQYCQKKRKVKKKRMENKEAKFCLFLSLLFIDCST
jgi:hypothetical protein